MNTKADITIKTDDGEVALHDVDVSIENEDSPREKGSRLPEITGFVVGAIVTAAILTWLHLLSI